MVPRVLSRALRRVAPLLGLLLLAASPVAVAPAPFLAFVSTAGPARAAAADDPGRSGAEIAFVASGSRAGRLSSPRETAHPGRNENVAVSLRPNGVRARAGSASMARLSLVGAEVPASSVVSGADGQGRGSSGSVVFFSLMGVIAAGALWLLVSTKRERTKATRSKRGANGPAAGRDAAR